MIGSKFSRFMIGAKFVSFFLSQSALAQDNDEMEPGTFSSAPATEEAQEPESGTSVFESPKKTYAAPNEDPGPAVDERYNALEDSRGGFLGDLRLGPAIQLGLPHPVTYGGEGLYAKIVSFGFSTGSYTVTQISKAHIGIRSWELFARWHPFADAFFLGGAYGHQDIKGRFEDDLKVKISGFPTTVPTRVDAAIHSNYVSPRLGWLTVYDSGFTLGFEIGAQIPLSPVTRVDATMPSMSASAAAQVKATNDYKDLKKKADDAVKLLGKKTFPYLTLLKMGWLF